MMNFEEFKEAVAKNIKNSLPSEYSDAIVEVTKVDRTDKSYDGLVVRKPGSTIAPSINLNDCYELYTGSNLEDIITQIADVIKREVPDYVREMADITDYSNIRTKLFLKLSNYEAKKEYFDALPHRLIEDLVVTYHIMMDNSINGVSSVTINQDLLDSYGISEEELYHDALISAPNVLPVTLGSLGDMFGMSSGPEVTIVSNTIGMNGAASLLYPSVMDLLAAGEKVYILPSSVHEVLVHFDTGTDIDSLKETVMTANKTIVSEEDRLSNHVYMYEDGKIKIAI